MSTDTTAASGNANLLSLQEEVETVTLLIGRPLGVRCPHRCDRLTRPIPGTGSLISSGSRNRQLTFRFHI